MIETSDEIQLNKVFQIPITSYKLATLCEVMNRSIYGISFQRMHYFLDYFISQLGLWYKRIKVEFTASFSA